MAEVNSTAVNIDNPFTQKLIAFVKTLSPDEQQVFYEILARCAPKGTFPTAEELKRRGSPRPSGGSSAPSVPGVVHADSSIADLPGSVLHPIIVGAGIIGGVAGWLSGDGHFSNIPWNEIVNSTLSNPLATDSGLGGGGGGGVGSGGVDIPLKTD